MAGLWDIDIYFGFGTVCDQQRRSLVGAMGESNHHRVGAFYRFKCVYARQFVGVGLAVAQWREFGARGSD